MHIGFNDLVNTKTFLQVSSLLRSLLVYEFVDYRQYNGPKEIDKEF